MLSTAAAGGIQQKRHLVPGALDTECAPVDGGTALEEAGQFFSQGEHKLHLLPFVIGYAVSEKSCRICNLF